jgi:hypothetical protein
MPGDALLALGARDALLLGRHGIIQSRPDLFLTVLDETVKARSGLDCLK